MVTFTPATEQQAIEYYTSHFRPIELARLIGLDDFERREFGWFLFPGHYSEGDPFNRNRSFKNMKALVDALPSIPPYKLYYGAVYQRAWGRTITGAPWAHNELHFDIDVNGSESIRRDGMCHCGDSNDREERKRVCPACFELVREAGIFLMETLDEDFGFPKRDGMVYFSGTRGIHVHYPKIKKIGMDENEDRKIRRNIINYISLVIEKEDKNKETGEVSFPVAIGDRVEAEPLRRRIDSLVYRWFFTKAPPQTIEHARFSPFALEMTREQLASGRSMIDVTGDLVSRNAVTSRQMESMRNAVLTYRYPRYDGSPTYDTRKVIKVPLSIDCNTGCIVMRIDDLAGFQLDDVDHVLNHVRQA